MIPTRLPGSRVGVIADLGEGPGDLALPTTIDMPPPRCTLASRVRAGDWPEIVVKGTNDSHYRALTFPRISSYFAYGTYFPDVILFKSTVML